MSDAAEAPERAEPPGARRASALVVAIALVVIAIVSTIGWLARSPDPCARWERQLDELSRALTKHRLAQGDARQVAVLALEDLELPCAKVAAVRDDCVAAYRALHLAEVKQHEAKAAVARLRRAVEDLAEPQRQVARLRFLESKSPEQIGAALSLDPEAVAQQLAEAIEAIGPEKLRRLDADFERAIGTSEKLLRTAADKNASCDAAFKRLVEDAQAR